MIKLKTEKDIILLRESGRRLAQILQTVAGRVAPGVSAESLDELAQELIEKGGDKPAFLGYRPKGAQKPFPAALCVSLNDEVVHGIPSAGKILREGDIVSLDLGLNHQGYFTDMAITVPVGKIDPAAQKLLTVTEEAMYAGIKEAYPGNHLGDIGAAIGGLIKKNNYGLVTDLSGHGVGFAPHEEPFVPNFGRAGQGLTLAQGLVIAIEPMANMGTGSVVDEDDGYGYTLATEDGRLSAHFEHTVLVGPKGPEILTKI